MRDSEVDYTVEAILKCPENESSWRYLRGLYRDDTEGWVKDSRVSSVCLKVLNTKRNFVFALSTLLDLLCNGFQPGQEFTDSVDSLWDSEDNKALEAYLGEAVCSLLEKVDSMRASYWKWRKSKLPPAL